jgi:hypothetical protein
MKARRLAFVSSAQHYTQLFMPTARHLESEGVEVFWISHRKSEYLWLINEGIAAEKILDTSTYRQGIQDIKDPRGILAELESEKPPLIHDIISMDRMLRLYPVDLGYRYLGYISQILQDFMIKNNIDAITGGHDSALQILCYLVCRKLQRNWIIATGVRLPKDRIGFVTDHTHSTFIPLREVDAEAHRFADEFYEQYRQFTPRPYFYAYSDALWHNLKLLPHHLREFLRSLWQSAQEGGSVVTWYSNTTLVKMFFTRRWNMFRVRLADPFEKVDANRPYVLYALQTQPESSIDVFASHFSDQTTLIRQLSKAVPVTHDIYVKAHPSDIGGKSLGFFETLKSIPGVKLIHPNANSQQLVRNASLVISPAGTMCLEAALLGKYSIVFTNIFFTELPAVHYCKSPIELVPLIRRLLNESMAIDFEARTKAYLAKIHASSFLGQCDGFFRPFTEEDISALSRSLQLALNGGFKEKMVIGDGMREMQQAHPGKSRRREVSYTVPDSSLTL